MRQHDGKNVIGDMDIGQNGELFEDAYISPKAES